MAKNRVHFTSPDLKVNFPQLEHELLAAWEKKGVVKKYLAKNKDSKKYFSFLDGPITANNPMGVHHAWGRTYKDIWQKFKNMQGFRQRFQNGFDAQGLWVEVRVEKELGFKNKKDIEAFGVAKFVDLCRERVKKYSGIQTEQSKRLGYFMDWDHSYYTLSEDNNYMIWNFLKRCFDSGWIYKGNDSVPWCPRCETAISQHEMLTEDYKEVTHESVFLAFPIVGQKDEYLMVWTTTPWTIPANIAVAVAENLDYSQVEIKGEKYWLAKETVSRVLTDVKYKELKVVKGAKLVGLRYKGAFDDLPNVIEISAKNDKFHTVIATDEFIMPITVTEGTGLVHTAVSAGTEDFKLGKKLGLPMIPVIEDDASYLEGFGFLSGQNAKKNPEIILDYLRELDASGKRFFFKIENYTHRYPACWRCKTELVWKVTDEWYIAMDKPPKLQKPKIHVRPQEKWDEEEGEEIETIDTRTLRDRMMSVATKINWIPAFGKDRELDWLTTMHDWLISKKNRYWGLALPIWECKKCGNFEVIGSKEELKERAIEGWKSSVKKSPHKPQIDEVKIKCSKCGSIVERIEPVGNPWLDAGIVPFSTISSNNKAANFEPTTTEPLYSTDKKEWQNWFPGDFITESFPGQFKNWFYALIAMSTVMENTLPFDNVLGFGSMLDEKGEAFHKSKGNSIEFNDGADKIGVDVMRWMFARANPAENLLFGPNVADEVRRRFHLKLWNVFNFFVTYANLDGWDPKDKKSRSQNILDKWILSLLNETVQIVTDELEKFNSFTASAAIEKFVDDLSLWFIRRSRSRVGPAAESEKDKESFFVTTHFVLVTLSKLLAPFTPFIADVIYTSLTKEISVHLSDWPKVSTKINKELMGDMVSVREAVERVLAERKELGIAVKQPLSNLVVFYPTNEKLWDWGKKLLSEELNIKNVDFMWYEDVEKDKKLKEYFSKGFFLDTRITPELIEEAKARDLVRKIQEERKRLGLNLTQKVNARIEKIPTDNKLVQWMIKRTQINKLTEGEFKVVKV